MNRKLWIEDGKANKGGAIQVAILGSATVDAAAIDPSTLVLGAASAAPGSATLADVSTATGAVACDPKRGKKDGIIDLLVTFDAKSVVAGSSVPYAGQHVSISLTGEYYDGLPFGCSDVVQAVGNIPKKFEPIGGGSDGGLSFPNPNPFNPVTRISYVVPNTQHVRLAVFDVAGRLVDELVNEVKGAGEYVVEWDAGTLPSGVYFYRLETGGNTMVRRATLLK